MIGSSNDRPSVVIAEDSGLMATRLQILLARDCEVIAVVTNGHELVNAVRAHRPDVIVSDIDMPVMTGLEAARLILQEQPDARMAFVSALLDPAIIRAALSLGALAFIAKRDAGRELASAVGACMEHKIYISQSCWKALDEMLGSVWNNEQ